MKSLYAEYVLEREGYETIENEGAFVSYKITGEECYIRDIFVRKEHRRSALSAKLADEVTEVAKKAGCKFLTGTVQTTLPSATVNTKLMFNYGFSILRTTQDRIVFVKEIK